MKEAIVVVDHGSRRAESNEQLVRVVELIRGRVPKGLLVAHAHMEIAAPSLADAVDGLAAKGATSVLVVPYMLAPGRHVTEDIPRLVQQAAAAHPGLKLQVTPCLGVDELLAELVLKRCTAVGLDL